MSGLACLFNLDGSPVNRQALLRMEAALAPHGPDGGQAWRQGSIGLVRTHFWTVPEEVGEEQPLPIAGGRYWIVSDARLDNRDELMPLLGGALRGGRPTDAELIVAAYEAWGDGCARRLAGDFAFVIWDSVQRRLFCARDQVGVRQLHYARTGSTLVIASSVGAVLAAMEARPAPNEALLRDLVAGRCDRWVQETAYRSILRLPPSFLLSATPAGHVTTRYYTLGETPAPSYAREREYVEHFRELFERTVRARMRSTHPVALLVSGGLDSSSIACTMERLVRTGGSPAGGRLYSSTFDRTPDADERDYLRAVTETCPHLVTTTLPGDDCWALKEFGGDSGYRLDEPEIGLDRSMMLGPMQQARADGCRVVMTGYWADQVLGGDAYHTPDMLRSVSLARMRRELPHFVRATRQPVWRLLPYVYLRSMLPERVKRLLRDAPAPLADAPRTPAPDLLPPPPLGSPAALTIYRQLTNGLNCARLLSHSDLAAHAGVEWRFPFLDRRLIDFLLTVPAHLRFRDGWTKYLLREAMQGVLPETVRRRKTFARFTELIGRGLRERESGRVDALLRDARIVRAGIVDQARLTAAWRDYRQDERPYRFRHLVGGLCVEAWLRHQEELHTSAVVAREHAELAYH